MKKKKAYYEGIQKGTSNRTFKFWGFSKDLKHKFEASYVIEGQEEEFMALVI